MIRKTIRNFLNKRNYEIIKQPYIGNLYPNLSTAKTEYYCQTPIGNYHLPMPIEIDSVACTLARGKFFEPQIIELGKRYIKNGSTVIDMGANFGQMSIEFSKFVGVEGKVYSFEAQNTVFNFLKKNIGSNECNNVYIFENAVYNKDGELVYFPKHDFSETSLFKGVPYSGLSLIGDIKNGVPVKTITIDSLHIETPVSFIKVDVQGADLFGMQGAINTILKHKPTIVFEFEQSVQSEFKTSFDDYVEFVKSINYKFVEVVSSINYVIAPKD